MASNKDKGFACPVTLGYPDPGELEKVVEKQKENAARKKAEQNTSFCLLLGRDFPPTRVKNTKWCLCGSCRSFKTVHENLCCREVLEIEMVPRTCLGQSDAVEGLKKKLKDCSKCITDHPSFEKLLDVETLSIMVENRRLDKKRRWMVCEDQKMIYRYCSYRSFVIWAYGPMGMRKRFELPACVRAAIMAKFPVDGEKAAGHKGRKVARKDAVECDEDEWRDRSA